MNKSRIVETRQGKTAADIYQIQPDYHRYNQKYNMTRRGMWDQTINGKRGVINLGKLMTNIQNGYTVLDWAFFKGAHANAESTGFNVNRPNMFGNSWEPLAKSARGAAPYPPPDVKLSKWQGSPKEASKLLRKMSTDYFGADMAGFCLLDRNWVYSHWWDDVTKKDYPIKFSDEPGYEGYTEPVQLEDKTQVIPKEMKYVIVMIYEMDEAAISAAPTLNQMAGTRLAYSQITFTTASVAEFIRGMGYNAIPSANCTALSIPLAIDAGLGQLSRNAKLINPLFGPRCRISKVITDLPLEPDKPINFGVTEFCNKCGKCAHTCPSKAIPFGERSFEAVNDAGNGGVLTWQLDHKKCSEYCGTVGTNCGICINTCPFNKSRNSLHGMVRWFIKNFKAADPLILKIDNALGYGKYRSPNEHFWKKIIKS